MKRVNSFHSRLFYLRKIISLAAFHFIVIVCYGQTVTIPAWFSGTFKNKGLDKKYDIKPFLKPSFLEADFNGDGTEDIAVLVTEKATKHKGILLMHGRTNDHFIFGAGSSSGSSGKDFKWADTWSVYNKKSALETQFNKESGDIIGSKTIKLARPGILIEDYEDGAPVAGGIIYWSGKRYIWIQQGE